MTTTTTPATESAPEPIDDHMLPLLNHTSLQARLGLFTNPDGHRSLTSVLAATLSIPEEDGALCLMAPEQLVPQSMTTYVGERGRSSILRPADLVPYKPGTDVMLVGHAHAPGGRPVAELTASVTVGSLHKSLVVVGDRNWERTASGVVMTTPVPFERMPIVYERAFGGCPPSQRDLERPDLDERNPVGTGYCTSLDDAVGMRLPNLEDPEARITAWRDVPPVAGFGAIDAHWASRRCLAGTYDAAWRAQQRPRQPRDLDPRFYSVASPSLWSAASLFGELDVVLVHLATTPVLRFCLPDLRVRMDFHLGGHLHERRAELWTIVLEPDERRVSMVWGARCRLDARRSRVDKVEVHTDAPPTEKRIDHAS